MSAQAINSTLVLEKICAHIQITDTQHTAAEKRYQRVGEWLTEEDTKFDRKLAPEVFPQGSMQLRTTVRPVRAGEEVVPFDLDAVCLCDVDPRTTSSKTLYNMVLQRLQLEEDFKGRLKPKSKCITLNYKSDDFCLDVVPACVDPSDSEKIRVMIAEQDMWEKEVPPIQTWKATDPKRFDSWLEGRAPIRVVKSAARSETFASESVEDLPAKEHSIKKAPLRKISQLLKHQRNLKFMGSKGQPSSIFLTTLAGNHYGGQGDLTEGLECVLLGIRREILAASPKRIVVYNPSDLPRQIEDLAAPMTDKAYQMFREMIGEMVQQLQQLKEGKDSLESLKKMAGARVAKVVSGDIQTGVERARSAGTLGVGAAQSILLLETPKPSTGISIVPKNNFHSKTPPFPC